VISPPPKKKKSQWKFPTDCTRFGKIDTEHILLPSQCTYFHLYKVESRPASSIVVGAAAPADDAIATSSSIDFNDGSAVHPTEEHEGSQASPSKSELVRQSDHNLSIMNVSTDLCRYYKEVDDFSDFSSALKVIESCVFQTEIPNHKAFNGTTEQQECASVHQFIAILLTVGKISDSSQVCSVTSIVYGKELKGLYSKNQGVVSTADALQADALSDLVKLLRH
jgi:hypothetical protein